MRRYLRKKSGPISPTARKLSEKYGLSHTLAQIVVNVLGEEAQKFIEIYGHLSEREMANLLDPYKVMGPEGIERLEKIDRRLLYLPVDDLKRIRCMRDEELFLVSRTLDIVYRIGPRVNWDKFYAARSNTKLAIEIGASEWVWFRLYGRIPKKPEVRRITTVLIPALKPKFKIFLKGLRRNPEADQHWVEAWARLVVTFGDRALQIPVEKVHDLGIDLRGWSYSKELCDWLWKHRASSRWNDLVRVANNWEALKDVGEASLNMPLKELVALLASFQYEGVKHLAFARECAKWGVSQWDFEDWQDRWLKGLANLKYESVPRIDFTRGDYRFYRLQKDDPRGLFLGEYTDCCQWPGGVGASCAWHGHEDPDGAFFVVEYRGQIIAQSWAWRRDSVLVFDNIEVLGADDERKRKVLELYKEAARLLLGRLCIKEVRVGCGYTDVDLSDLPDVDSIPTPEGVYTDASQQKLLARVE